MKHSISIVATLGFALFAHAQGTVYFGNRAQTAISTNSIHNGPASGLMATEQGVPGGPGAYYFALFVAPSTVTSVSGINDPNWTFTGLYATNTITPGVFSMIDDAALPNNPAYVPGSTLSFFAVGWSGTIGVSWAEADAWYNNGDPLATGWFGWSGVATNQVVLGPLQPAPTPFFGRTILGETGGWLLNRYDPIPEPSGLALVLLAGTLARLRHGRSNAVASARPVIAGRDR